MAGLIMHFYKLVILSAFITILSPNKSSAKEVETIKYKLTPIMQSDDMKALELSMAFKADASGKTEIDLPDEWGGGLKFYENLKDFSVKGAKSISSPTNSSRRITSEPYANISVKYTIYVNKAKGEDIPLKDNFTYPSLAPDWFFIVGPSIISTIKGRENDKIDFSWKLPKGWNGATNLEYKLTKGASFGVAQSVFIAGRDVKIKSLKTDYGDLRIAWRGNFNFNPQDFIQATHNIINSEQKFWKEGQRHFLVALSSLEAKPSWNSIRGSGLGDSFAIVTTPDNDINALKVILAHEYFHSWNLIRLGDFDTTENEALQYWFSEGFTDYYGRKLAYESGAVGENEFMHQWNEALNDYSSSKYRNSPNTIIAEKFWSDAKVQKLPYQRGAMLAAILDAKWKAKGKSIDGFMHVLRKIAKAEELKGIKSRPLLERLNDAAKEYGVDFGDLIEKNIIKGEEIILSEDIFGPNFKVISEDIPVLDYGYDGFKSREAGVFIGVDINGPAYAAGLRDGMKRVSNEGGMDSKSILTWHVIDLDGKPRDISYKPAGKTSYKVQKIIRNDKPTTN